MPSTDESETVLVGVPMPRELRDRLRAMAEARDRTMAAEARIAIRNYIVVEELKKEAA